MPLDPLSDDVLCDDAPLLAPDEDGVLEAGEGVAEVEDPARGLLVSDILLEIKTQNVVEIGAANR